MQYLAIFLTLFLAACGGGSGGSSSTEGGEANNNQNNNSNNNNQSSTFCSSTININGTIIQTDRFDQNNDGCLDSQELNNAQQFVNNNQTNNCPAGEFPASEISQNINTHNINFTTSDFDTDNNGCINQNEALQLSDYIAQQLANNSDLPSEVERTVYSSNSSNSFTGLYLLRSQIMGTQEATDGTAQLDQNNFAGEYEIEFNIFGSSQYYPGRVMIFYSDQPANVATSFGAGEGITLQAVQNGSATLQCTYNRLEHDCRLGNSDLPLNYASKFSSASFPETVYLNFWVCTTPTGGCDINDWSYIPVTWN